MAGPDYSSHLEEPKKPTISTPLAAKFCDYLEKALLWFFDDYNCKKDNYWLKNGYASADETDPASNLTVVGKIPVSVAPLW